MPSAPSPNETRRLPQADEGRGIALYLRLANIFRARIRSGVWSAGDRLPTIPDLTQEFGVGTITVRQAFQILSEEGLIQSFRGKGTFVRADATAGPKLHSLRSVINNPLTHDPDLKIKVLQRMPAPILPAELQGRHSAVNPYVRLQKIHSFSGTPFALMDIFIAAHVYETFPKNADARYTIPRLINDHSNASLAVSDVEITIDYADDELARLLDYNPTGAIVKLRRWRTDAEDNILMASLNYFRADLFVLDISETHSPHELGTIRPTPALRK
ncbi:MAG TPA: GntR family transcriptional regulator [Xanthobacteraceae bacterium]|nr:GntR family transcriptional regulator [Xanthobacteraceae bacterium]